MAKNRRKPRPHAQHQEPVKTSRKRLMGYLLFFAFGAIVSGGAALLGAKGSAGDAKVNLSVRHEASVVGHRTLAQLIALSDLELESVDIVEMNIAVAHGIPGLETLNYDDYRRTVDAWTDQFRAWLPTVEYVFLQDPSRFHSDINFFRLGMIAQFLDHQVGVAYVEEQKRAQVEARKTGRKAEVAYIDPGQLLLHGLINTKRGTCGTMPALHVAMARRMGWPVGLACADSHYVCRYDDGQHVYNIEATDTGRGGFAAGSDRDYIEKEGVSRKAIAVGSDLRKLTAREMLGVFVQARARHFADTGESDLAVRDYALAYTLFPKSRKVYIGLVGNLLPVGEKLFAPNEHGHPVSLAAYLSGLYARRRNEAGLAGAPAHRADPLFEVERINAINRRNMQRMTQPPVPSEVYRPHEPGAPHVPLSR